MRIDVVFGGQQLTPADVRDASSPSSTCCARRRRSPSRWPMAPRGHPARELRRKSSRASKAFERSDVRLAGERRMLAIPGFDLGNSPARVHARGRRGKDHPADDDERHAARCSAAQGARDVVVASYVNYTAVCTMLRAALRGGADIAMVCAGQDRQFALEDAACAGRYVHNVSKRLTGVELNDAAQACALIDRKYGDNIMRLFDASEHGRALAEAGFGEDLAACAAWIPTRSSGCRRYFRSMSEAARAASFSLRRRYSLADLVDVAAGTGSVLERELCVMALRTRS